MSYHITRRRPGPATIVGSGLAVAAAASLLAFSSLAEQAGLQGLATRGIEPAAPVGGGRTRAIRLPAPAVPPEPADAIEQLVRDTIAGTPSAIAAAPAPRAVPGAPAAGEPRRAREAKKDKPRRDHAPARRGPALAFAPRETADDTETTYGPPYGHAYGHDRKPKAPKPARNAPEKKQRAAPKAEAAPTYARRGAGEAPGSEEEAPRWKPSKSKPGKLAKHAARRGGHGKANGHANHAHDDGRGRGKGKGHRKHYS
ncbi:MAG: hypothetical protein ABR613_10910 [Actinomycetota bacterium]